MEKNCTEEYCECVHLLKVGLGDTVEMIVIDEGQTFNANHPMHLHGHYFRVIGMDKVYTDTVTDTTHYFLNFFLLSCFHMYMLITSILYSKVIVNKMKNKQTTKQNKTKQQQQKIHFGFANSYCF